MMDHPNIAKVLDAGATETGRPYFVMEYIRGIPILEYCDQEKVDTRARLELFASVCHAIQHAHQKGIIHRDIKPSNVLVTLHDGVPVPKVIDFGVAKATNCELTTKTLFTEHRQMIGTPAYMSPEQAEMSGLDIDTRSDVYSLGVLLYELLTGTTPFDTRTLLESGFDELLRAIREDEPHKPSTRVSKLGDTGTRTAQQRRVEPKALSLLLRGDIDWIVMKCLEKDRTRRYETANSLAADIRRHLVDEPVTAGPPSSTYRLRKFVRRNRVQVIAASVVLAALLAGLVAASWGLVQTSLAQSAALERQVQDEHASAVETARLGRNAEAVAALLGQCEDALRAGDASQAKVALDAARKRAEDGGAVGDAERLARLAADLDLATELDAIEQYRWTWTQNRFGDENVAATRTREALRRFGADPATSSVEEAASLVGASTIRGQIVVAMDRQLWREDADGLRAVLLSVDADPYRDELREAILARDRKKVETLARDPAALEQPPEFAIALGRSTAIPEERRRELLQAALIRRPSDIALLMTLQSLPSLNAKEAAGERIRWLQAAIAADPMNSAAYTNLGRAFTDTDQTDKSLACFRKAVEVDPGNAVACNNLGAALNGKGRHAESIPWFRKALALDPKDSLAHSNLGESLVSTGHVDEGIACYRKAIELEPRDAYAYAVLGDALRCKGEEDAAIASYRKSVELDPNRAEPYVFLGELLLKRGKADEGVAYLRKAVELDPKNVVGCLLLSQAVGKEDRSAEALTWARRAVELAPTMAAAHVALGIALHADGQVDAAIACFRKAIEIDPDCADAHHDLGATLHQLGRPADALPSYRRAAELAPTYAPYQFDLALTLQELGQHDAALDAFRRTTELDPKNACADYNLGVELAAKRRWDEAIAAYQQALELDPDYAEAHCNLAMCLQNTGRFAEAVPYIRRGHELGSKRAGWRYPTAERLREAEMRAALEVKLEDLIAGRIEPADDAERLEYAQMCAVKGLHHSVVELMSEAFADDPRLADDLGARHRYDAAVSAALASAGRSKDAAPPDDRERARLRKQALDWLRADLELRARTLDTGTPADRAAVRDALREWQVDADLDCLREGAALASLPAEDRDAFTRLWADVSALSTKAESAAPAERPR
jgi:tetratricopeptide (TPR) repeat protein